MEFLILDLIVSFIVFLFAVYFFTHDDFVILRRDISKERIFNISFLTALFSLFSARVFYIFSHPNPVFFNLLGFLLFPYFPGLSLVGAIIGGFVFLFLFCKLKKIPFERIFDFFSISFLISMPVGIVGSFGLNLVKIANSQEIFLFLTVLILLFFLKFILPKTLSGKIKDGSLGFLFMASFSVNLFIVSIFQTLNPLQALRDNLILIVIFILSISFLINKEFLKKLSFKSE